MALENARLYETVTRQRGAARQGGPLRAARAGGAAADRAAEAACAASTWPRGSRRRASSAATSTTSCRPRRTRSWSPLGDVSGKGVPAALYSAFASELVRSRTFRRRYTPEQGYARRACWRRSTPSSTSGSSRRTSARCATPASTSSAASRSSPTRACRTPSASSVGRVRGRSRSPASRSAPFDGTSYDEVTLPARGRATCSCSARTASSKPPTQDGDEFGTERLVEIVTPSATCRRARSSTPSSTPPRPTARRVAGRRHDGGGGEDHGVRGASAFGLIGHRLAASSPHFAQCPRRSVRDRWRVGCVRVPWPTDAAAEGEIPDHSSGRGAKVDARPQAARPSAAS